LAITSPEGMYLYPYLDQLIYIQCDFLFSSDLINAEGIISIVAISLDFAFSLMVFIWACHVNKSYCGPPPDDPTFHIVEWVHAIISIILIIIVTILSATVQVPASREIENFAVNYQDLNSFKDAYIIPCSNPITTSNMTDVCFCEDNINNLQSQCYIGACYRESQTCGDVKKDRCMCDATIYKPQCACSQYDVDDPFCTNTTFTLTPTINPAVHNAFKNCNLLYSDSAGLLKALVAVNITVAILEIAIIIFIRFTIESIGYAGEWIQIVISTAHLITCIVIVAIVTERVTSQSLCSNDLKKALPGCEFNELYYNKNVEGRFSSFVYNALTVLFFGSFLNFASSLHEFLMLFYSCCCLCLVKKRRGY